MRALVEIGVSLFGLASLWMAMGTSDRAKRWAPLVGLCGQPFWFALGLTVQSPGLVILAGAFTIVYLRGCWVQHRIRKVRP